MSNVLRNSRLTCRLAVAVVMVLTAWSPVVATPVVTFDHDVRTADTQPFPNTTAARNTFLTDVTALGGTEYDQNLTTGIPNGPNPSFGFPGSTITATTTNFTYQFVTFFAVNDTNNGPASSALIESEVATGVATQAVHNWITLSEPVNAFGVYLCQAGDVLGHPVTFELENTLVPGSVRDVVVNVGPEWQAYSIAYLGIIDAASPFNQITMMEDTDVDNNGVSDDLQDGIILDNLTVAKLLAGDVNGDHVVNGLDISLIASHWLASGSGVVPGDANGDGVVNGLDIAMIASNWLQSSAASATSVPEPGTFVLLALGCPAAFGLCRRRRVRARGDLTKRVPARRAARIL